MDAAAKAEKVAKHAHVVSAGRLKKKNKAVTEARVDERNKLKQQQKEARKKLQAVFRAKTAALEAKAAAERQAAKEELASTFSYEFERQRTAVNAKRSLLFCIDRINANALCICSPLRHAQRLGQRQRRRLCSKLRESAALRLAQTHDCSVRTTRANAAPSHHARQMSDTAQQGKCMLTPAAHPHPRRTGPRTAGARPSRSSSQSGSPGIARAAGHGAPPVTLD